jgi:hypothetical protein
VKNSIKLKVKPIGHVMEQIRQRTRSFMKSHGISDDAVQAQFRIIRELIKTGTKYGNFSPADVEIMVNVQVDENSITVEILNPINEASIEQLRELDKTIQFIRGYQDPFEAFMIIQKEASINSPLGHSNALDLSRIAYEEKAIIDFFVNEDNYLQISAIRKLKENNCNAV